MKKIGVFVVLVLLMCNFLFISLAYAESIPGMPVDVDKLAGGVDSALSTVDNIKSGDYSLKQPIISETQASGFKKILLAISDFFSIFNPFYKIVLGVEYSFTLAFILSIIIWLILFLWLSSIGILILGKRWQGYLAGFAAASLVGLSGTIGKAVDTLSTAIKTPKLAIVCLIVAIVIAVLSAFFSKLIRKSKRAAKREQEERDKEILHTSAKIEEKRLESYKNHHPLGF